MTFRAYLVDDEPLALDRLERLLAATGKVEMAGRTTDPEAAAEYLSVNRVDLLFLDIQMPGMTGFDLLERLPAQPAVIFTTAYNEYALQAFQVNSIDYLLKPVDPLHLDRALAKLERLRAAGQPSQDVRALAAEIASAMRRSEAQYPERIASRLGDRLSFVQLAKVTHFYAQDKLTYAVADGKSYCVDHSISELERKLDPRRFIRIHRATLLNADWVKEVAPLVAGSLLVRLRDGRDTELTVARDRARDFRNKLGW